MLRKIVLFGMLSLVSLVIFSCTPGSANEEEIRIGIIAPLTGGASVFGVASSNGSRLAFEEINERGGLLGLPVNYFLIDDEHTPAVSIASFQRLVHQDNVIAIVGPVTSGPANAVGAAAVQNRLPMIAPTATHEDVTSFGDFIFRACFLDAFQAYNMANFAYNNLGARTAAILFDSGMAYSEGLAVNFRRYFEALGGEIVASEAYISGAVDFRTQLTTIRATDADVLFLPDYFPVIALMAAQVRELGVTSTLLGADGWEGVFNVVDDPSILDGAFFSAHFAVDYPSPVVRAFVESYTERFDVPPNSFAALGFDAAGILAQAIEEAGSTDNEEIIRAMQNISFNGVTGPITFNDRGDPIKELMIIAIETNDDDETVARLYHRFVPE
ncbi:MAG: ABC transporter substrate-binding protein [Defluviitaleaceae bacterium]|nr:ABC transporter substrate-binding protein [Defluviitaleaceae bacterium]